MAVDFLQIISQLHDQHVDFVVVGGVAAALHGNQRVTFDLDIVPSLDARSWAATIDVLWSLGARPRIPETLESIRDIEQIRSWQRDKGMLALNMRTADGSVDVDLLVSESDRLVELRQRAIALTMNGRPLLIACIDDLIEMKQRAGRPQDLLDIAQLQDIQARSNK